MLVLASVLAATVIATTSLDVRSATNCPSTEDVAERLMPLLPVATAGTTDGRDVAHIEVGELQAGGAMELRLLLVHGDGAVVGDRRLLMQGTCQDMAETVATVIAAWETRPLTAASPDVAPAPTVMGSADLLRAQAVQPVPHQPQPWQLLMGAGVGAALVGGMAATGGLDIQVGRSAAHVQWRFGLASETDRQLGLGLGQVDWHHTSAVLGVGWRLLDPFWLLALDAGPVVGWATLTGSGFLPDRTQHSFDYGAQAGLRVGRKLGRLAVWAEWRSTLWAKGQRATLTGADSSADLPSLDSAASLGVSVLLIK
jgi:hypothetical protein